MPSPHEINVPSSRDLGALTWLCVGMIRLYQWTLSPLVGRSCRFQPTCSHYAEEVIRRYGPWRGIGLAVKRLAKCHPWGPSGYDPAP